MTEQSKPGTATTGEHPESPATARPDAATAVLPLSLEKEPVGVAAESASIGGRQPWEAGGSMPPADAPVLPSARGYGPPVYFPVPEGPSRAALGTDVVTCPECGQLATVDMARRKADDFCRRCDFPLFWARGTVVAPEGEESGASLRRLPGTVGRAATAALICPHCSEPNSPAAEICIRCSLSLHPVDIPEPAPVIVVQPEPEPEDPDPDPDPGSDWWWIVAVAAALVAIALVVGVLSVR